MTAPSLKVGDLVSVTETVSTYLPGRMDATIVPAGSVGRLAAYDPSWAYPWRVVLDDDWMGRPVYINLPARMLWGPVKKENA